jgi:formylglycine-generating enzyme required for sulfatase activity
MECAHCAAPARGAEPLNRESRPRSTGSHRIADALIPAGRFLMGDAHGDGFAGDGEQPVHPVTLPAYRIDITAVTNAAFQEFVETTGYRTDAERYGYSAVFHLAIAAEDADLLAPVPGSPWWRGILGADWRHPGGRLSGLDGLDEHPVVHVSWHDAEEYCRWAGRRLPTEAEWERASRGGSEGWRYPWGDELLPDGSWRCNIWQGDFPRVNSLEDGWITTAPVGSYPANGFGLYETTGNVWEWCADWWDPGYYAVSPAEAPEGPATGTARVMRGGSYLCHDSYCNRYRNAARSANTPDSSSGNLGFRTVAADSHA